MSLVPDGNMTTGSGNTRVSFIALNRIAEVRAKKDAKYRLVLARNGKPLLSHARKLTEAH